MIDKRLPNWFCRGYFCLSASLIGWRRCQCEQRLPPTAATFLQKQKDIHGPINGAATSDHRPNVRFPLPVVKSGGRRIDAFKKAGFSEFQSVCQVQ